jgi:hypothetical protein
VTHETFIRKSGNIVNERNFGGFNLDSSRGSPGKILQNKEVEEYYNKLREICHSDDEQQKVEVAGKMAKKINDRIILYLLERLARDTYSCKKLVLLVLRKTETSNENILRILDILHHDGEYQIYVEASETLAYLTRGEYNLESARKLLQGTYEAKRRSLEIYSRIWKSCPQEVIQDLKNVIFKGRMNYVLFRDIIHLFGEIGKEYSTETIKIFSNLFPDLERDDKKIILDSIKKFAGDHPSEILQFLAEVEERHDISSKFIPEILLLTVKWLPEETFDLMRKLASDDSESVRYSVFSTSMDLAEIYPENVLDILFILWQNIFRIEKKLIIDEHVSEEKIKSQFIKIALIRTSKALSILEKLAIDENNKIRDSAFEIASKLASKTPKEVFSLMEILLKNSDYETKKNVISFLKEDWNICSKETLVLLKKVADEELKILREKIRMIFLQNKQNSNEAVKLLKNLECGGSKTVFDVIHRTAVQLHTKKERIPEVLLLDGTSIIEKEVLQYLSGNQVENWKEGLNFLVVLSGEYEISMRIISLKILPRYVSASLDTVLKVLEKLIVDDVSQVRTEAIGFLVHLMEEHPAESYEIIARVHDSQNSNVRTDIARNLSHFKKNFPRESFLLMEKYAQDPDPDVRIQVALSIPPFADAFCSESLNIISKLCLDKNDVVLRSAFNFLEEFMARNSENVLSLLEELYLGCTNITTREMIASLLGNFGEEYSGRIIKLLETLARDPVLSIQSRAFSSFDKIGKYQPEKAMEILNELSVEKSFEIKQKVVRSIGILGESFPHIDLIVLESFLKDDDISVGVELASTVAKMGRNDPRHATGIIKKMVSSLRTAAVGEAIAEAMTYYGVYCPYEAMKVLSHFRNYPDTAISRKAETSVYSLREKMEDFSYIKKNCFLESFLTLRVTELLSLLEIIVKKTAYKEENFYSKEIAYRYRLYHTLLESSTVTKIGSLESLLDDHISNFGIVDENIEKAFATLKEIANLLGKQNYYSKRDDKIENLKNSLEAVDRTEHLLGREFHEFDNPDLFILQSVLRAWKDIISVEFVKLRGRAELRVLLESRNMIKREYNIVRLGLANEGISKAENITVSILPSSDYSIMNSHDGNLGILSPGESNVLEFHIKLKEEQNLVRVSFAIKYDDAEKEGKRLSFGDQVTLAETEEKYVEIINPYRPGNPLRTPEMFYGRDSLLEAIEKTLMMKDRTHVLILHGQRRTGKTSILYQLGIRLGHEFLPVVFDFQGVPPNLGTENESIPPDLRNETESVPLDLESRNFFYWMTFEIWKEISRRGIEVLMPDQERFSRNPAFYFRDIFLREVREKLGDCILVFMMDEFESIDYKIREGKIDEDILPFMRNLMQHYDKMDFIFSGTHRLEEMSSDYWSILFNIGLYHKISFLERHEAIQLICDPVKESMRYDPLAVEKILEMTAGHPYFVQLICYYLVNHQIKRKQNYVTIEDVNDVLEEVVIAGTPHFQYIWDGMTRVQRILLVSLTKILSSQGVLTVADIFKYLKDLHFEINEQRIREILKEFLKREVIEQKSEDCYQFKIELIRIWCDKNKMLYEVMEESE